MQLVWDEIGQRTYETGVDHAVLYIPNSEGDYDNGVAWNGLTSVSETPTGAESNPQYADNIMYLNLFSAELFGATIEALTYPDEFSQFDGVATPTPGVHIGQQNRGAFGLCYRTLKGNDLQGTDFGYKLHLVYGAQASPSEKAYSTINDSPEAVPFSWDLTTTPVAVTGLKPTAILVVDSSKVDADTLVALEQMLYGDDGVDPVLPLPDTVVAMFAGGVTVVTPIEPAYNDATDTITIPAVTGVTYRIGGIAVEAGPVVITANTMVTATPSSGYVFSDGVDNDWLYNYTP